MRMALARRPEEYAPSGSTLPSREKNPVCAVEARCRSLIPNLSDEEREATEGIGTAMEHMLDRRLAVVEGTIAAQEERS